MKRAPENLSRSVTILTELVAACVKLRRDGFSAQEIEDIIGDGSIAINDAERHLKARVEPNRKSVQYCYNTKYHEITTKRVRELGTKVK